MLIITYYWPPAGGSGVQRWLKFVKYLQEFGIEPVVYTALDAKYPLKDPLLTNEVPKSVEVIKKPIKEPNSLISILGAKKKTTSAGFLAARPGFAGKVSQYIRANYFIPDARKYWIKPSVKFLSTYLLENNISTIISTGPPHSLHLIGLKLKQKLPVKWIADFRDPWTNIDYFHHLPFTKEAREKHHQLEQEVLKKADHIVVVGPTMKEDYLKFNKNISVISNGYDGNGHDENYILDFKFSLVHIGMMNADRNPETLFEVLSEMLQEDASFAQDLNVKLIGKVAAEVRSSISKFGLESWVEYIDYTSHKEVISFQRKAQVLLLVINDVPGAKGIVTGKIFEYLKAKRPVLALAPPEGDLAKILLETKSGKVFNFKDKQFIKKHILELYQSFKNNELFANTLGIEKYHRKNLTGQLAALIKKQHQ